MCNGNGNGSGFEHDVDSESESEAESEYESAPESEPPERLHRRRHHGVDWSVCLLGWSLLAWPPFAAYTGQRKRVRNLSEFDLKYFTT